ncbi:MAG: GDP-mannose 4,6-dehydratase [Pseudomonadales bacterium]|nr:GDP-mannose 4,6-dehydratase [Candidatus Woesebacteria bacterium]MCB9802223.1 GDP-mannose 4,6-dehydratase [Pseudomonadales bacterium]
MSALDHNAPILLTGGTGFAGSHLYDLLVERGYTNLHLTSLTGSHTARFPQATVHALDLTNTEATCTLFKQVHPTAIVHLASIPTTHDPSLPKLYTLHQNIAVQDSVLEAMRLHTPTARLLAITSAEVYGHHNQGNTPLTETTPFTPANEYAVSKVYQDALSCQYATEHNLDIVRVRPFNHVGPRQTPHFVVASFAKQIVQIENGAQETLQVGNLDAVRDFTDVRDVVRAYLVLLENGVSGDVYNVGSGVGISITSLLDILREHSRAEISVVQDKARLRPSDNPVMIADVTKLTTLGWQPTLPLKTTVLDILAYWREQL